MEMQKIIEDHITEVLSSDMKRVVQDFDTLINE